MATHDYVSTINGATVTITVAIPELTDSANIQTALSDLSDSILDNLKPYLTGNVVPSASTNGNVTVTNTSGTTFGSAGKIFVQSTEPVTKAVGDVWMW